MQKESDGLDHTSLAQLRSQRNQVVVVNPDQIVGFEQLHQFTREGLVDLVIDVVLLVRVLERLEKIMEYGPKRAIAESDVELLVLLAAEIQRRIGHAVPAH